jgi:hypothetical protein
LIKMSSRMIWSGYKKEKLIFGKYKKKIFVTWYAKI